MLNSEPLPHQVIKTRFLSREVGSELAQRGQFRFHSSYMTQGFTWLKGIHVGGSFLAGLV